MQVVNVSRRRPRRRRRAGPGAGRRARRQPQQRQPGHAAATACRRPRTCSCGSRMAGAAYPPCVDGDYDMTVIGHEYTHAITNRMIAGPDAGISGFQGGSMGEAWGDLTATEYLFENGFRAPGDTPFVDGRVRHRQPRSTASATTTLSKNPLNYSDLGFDLVGPGGARRRRDLGRPTNLRVRAGVRQPVRPRHAGAAAAVRRRPDRRRRLPGQPALDPARCSTRSCCRRPAPCQHARHARQHARRRPGPVRRRQPGHHLERVRRVRHGPGRDHERRQRHRRDAELRLAVREQRDRDAACRSATRPARWSGCTSATTRRGRCRSPTPTRRRPSRTRSRSCPGSRSASSRPGPASARAGSPRSSSPAAGPDLVLNLPRNLASTAAGATVTGDGVNLDAIADDTEATDWASLDGVAGKQVTVDLAGDRAAAGHPGQRLRAAAPGHRRRRRPGPQNRFSALRSFQILACNATVADCCHGRRLHPGVHQPGRRVPGAGVPSGRRRS